MSNPALPKHIAIVMDGNGRWAKARSMPRSFGHVKGANAAEKIVNYCAERNIGTLTLFTFGAENWRRPKSEVNLLMRLFLLRLRNIVSKLHQKNVRLQFIGQRELFGKQLLEEEVKAVELTKHNTGLTVVFAVSYSGQWDICEASKAIAAKVEGGALSPDDITPDLFEAHLKTSGLPPVDLFIRTSGEKRMSNFLLWQLAYAEMYFTDVFWPDFTPVELAKAIDWYTSRERRFGVTSEQLKEALC